MNLIPDQKQKPMASNVVINRKSALSWQTKRSALVGEVSRRLLNMDSQSCLEEGQEVLNAFCKKMWLSGYSEYERSLILREGEARVRNIKNLVAQGKRPLYRTAEYKKYDRAIEKQDKKRTWYGNKESVLFVQATHKERLRTQIQEIADRYGLNIKVVERGGRTIKAILQKSEVERMKCYDPECIICLTTGDKGNCNKENVGYTIKCKTCLEEKPDQSVKEKRQIMHGETGRTARIRCAEHHEALKRKKNSNLWEHCVTEHGGLQAEFEYKVDRSFHRDSLLRQIEEADRLESEEGTILNDKLEFVQPFAIQMRATRMTHRS